MKERICGIYKISFINNNKVYIGQSVNIYRRIAEHWMSARATKDYLNIRTQRDYLLPIHRAMRKYGTQNTIIEIIERCTREERDDKERQWINYYRSDDKEFGYNLAHGGQ